MNNKERFDPSRHDLAYAAKRLEHFAKEASLDSDAQVLTEERLCEIIAETIQRVLYPESGGLVTHQHRRVRQWDEDGTEWRGVLYRVEKESEL